MGPVDPLPPLLAPNGGEGREEEGGNTPQAVSSRWYSARRSDCGLTRQLTSPDSLMSAYSGHDVPSRRLPLAETTDQPTSRPAGNSDPTLAPSEGAVCLNSPRPTPFVAGLSLSLFPSALGDKRFGPGTHDTHTHTEREREREPSSFRLVSHRPSLASVSGQRETPIGCTNQTAGKSVGSANHRRALSTLVTRESQRVLTRFFEHLINAFWPSVHPIAGLLGSGAKRQRQKTFKSSVHGSSISTFSHDRVAGL
ncbi:unnamed protein product [Protopolystoma xenopodis]|uniref:Uncharacterized protein n=1 Tax=Protopolystoma xenopodis TaxID=117903 RepID=A0A448XSF4_9PLAT|nr:unnamed protein product [Protopolystoma xenopodis]